MKYFLGAVNLVADALSRIHHPVSATPAATISIHTIELQIIGAEEGKQEVCELLVEDAYFSPIVNVLHKEAKVTEEVVNLASQCSKGKLHRNSVVGARLFPLNRRLHCHRYTGVLCILLVMQSDVISEAYNSPLGGGHQGAEKTAAAIASQFD